MRTVDFLRHVLADSGLICIDLKNKGKGFRHRFFKTFEEAAAYVLEQDARGETVYHACATFKDATSRKQINVLYLKSFWGDVDVGPDKPYKTRDEAEDALIIFLHKTGWPPPTVVYSGPFGMHLYWVFDTPITPEEWRPLAETFRALCKQHGFHLDHSRTADHASVLRPIGTHNRKYASADLVSIAHVSSPVRLADLPFDRPQAQLHQPSRSRRLLEGASVYNDVPSDAHRIADACAQIRNFRDNEGNIPYDPWLYAIWTLHFTLQGDDIAHEWSSGHPKYTYEETERKLAEATSPIKCTTFDAHNDLCKTCEYWGKISTPLQLGRSVRRQQEPERSENLIYKPAATEPDDNYINTDRGLFHVNEDKSGKIAETLISKFPIYLTSVCRDELTTDTTLIFEVHTPRDVELLSIAAAVLFSNQGIPEMHRKGAVIHEGNLFRDYARKRMDIFSTHNAPKTLYSQFGWKDHDNAFLIGSKLITQSGVIPVIGAPELERRSRRLGPRGGSLDAWSVAANKLFATGCEPQSFALCCSFGAVLMRFLVDEEGGAIVNLMSETSATGKTTALEAVASVWGELNGLRLIDEDTQIARGIFLAVSGNLPCVFDELHNRDPDSIRSFITMVTTGRDKQRAKIDGTLRPPSGDWQTILVLASNVSLTSIMQAKNSEEAQQFRILELITDQTFTGHDGDKLRRDLKENRGWAGEAFIRFLLQPGVLQFAREAINYMVDVLQQQKGLSDQRYRYWVRAIACARVAGYIVTQKMKILDFNVERIVDYVIDRCLESKNNELRRDNVQMLNEALYEIWASTLVVADDWKPHSACLVLNAPSQNRVFLARRVRDTGRLYVTRTWLRKWLTRHNINPLSFTKDLKARKVIVNDSKFITLGAGTDFDTGGQIVTYELDMHHPEMAGALEVSERSVPMDEKEKKPISRLRVPPQATSGLTH